MTSPLPRSPEYWDDLARRIRADAAGPLARYATVASPLGWPHLLARRAAELMVTAAAMMLLVWLSLPVAEPPAAHRWVEPSVVPTDPVGALIAGAAPPGLESLLVHFPPPEDTP